MHLSFGEIGLVFVILFFVTGNIIWILLDRSPALWDIAGHSQRGLYVAQLLRGGHFLSILQMDTIYPPFAYMVAASLFLLFGAHTDIPQYSLLLWTAVLCLSTYSIAVQLYHKKSIGVGACLLLVGYPLLLHFSRIFDLDFPQTALVTAAFAALLRAKKCTDHQWTLVTAVLIALALVTKWTSVIFLSAPVAMILISAIRNRDHRRTVYRNLLHGVVLIVIIAGPWYALNGVDVLKSSVATRNNGFSVPFENLTSIKNALYYIGKTTTGMSWPLALFAGAGVLRLLYKHTRSDWFLLVWCALPYLLLTFVLYSKESRYFLPVFPALAIASAAFVSNLPGRRRLRMIGWSVIGVLVIFLWLETSWHVRLLPSSWYVSSRLALTHGYYEPTPKGPGFGFAYPTQYQTNLPDIVDTLAESIRAHPPTSNTVQIAVVPNSIFLTAQQIQYYAKLNGIDSVRQPFRLEYALSSRVRGPHWRTEILKADYLITKIGDQGPPVWGPSLSEISAEELKKKSDIFSQFELIATFPLDGIERKPQEARLYRRR